MAVLFDQGIFSIEGLSGEVLPGAKLFFYASGSSTPQATYADDDLTIPNANPVVAAADGRFPPIWLSPLAYKIVLKSFDDVTLVTRDPINGANTPSDGAVTANSLTNDPGELEAIGDKLIPTLRYQHSATVAPAYLTIADKLREGVSLRNFGGAVGNSSANTAALNDFAEAVAEGGSEARGRLLIPDGEWELSGAVNLQPDGLQTGCTIEGVDREYSRLFVDGDVSIFSFGSNLRLADLAIEQRGTAGTGVALTTPTTIAAGQANYCQFERLKISNFKVGLAARYSLWSSFRDLAFIDNLCGIRVARNNDMLNPSNPDAVSGWNALNGTGWFHNALTLDNILFLGGEVGLMGALGAGVSLNNVTAQGQNGDPAGNQFLSPGALRTGIWVDGGKTADQGWAHDWSNIYAEATDRPLMIRDQRLVRIAGLFVQGADVSSPYTVALDQYNSTVEVSGATGQDFFQYMARGDATSTLRGRLPGLGTVANYSFASGGRYLPNNDRPENYTRKFIFSKTDASTTTTFTVPVEFQDNGSYRVVINAIVDSNTSNHRRVAYDISRLTTAGSTAIDISSGTETNFTSAIVGRNLVFTVTTALRFDATVTVESISDFAGQSVQIAGA